MPPESSCGRARANSAEPEPLEQRQRAPARLARGARRAARARARRCRAPMRHGSSRSRCGISAQRRRRSAGRVPSTTASGPRSAPGGRRSARAASTCRSRTARRSRAARRPSLERRAPAAPSSSPARVLNALRDAGQLTAADGGPMALRLGRARSQLSCSLRGHYPTGSKGQRRGGAWCLRRYLSPLSREPPDFSESRRSVPSRRQPRGVPATTFTNCSSCLVVQHSNTRVAVGLVGGHHRVAVVPVEAAARG